MDEVHVEGHRELTIDPIDETLGLGCEERDGEFIID